MRAGASDFIERPVSRRELIDSIERAVSHASAGGARSRDGGATAKRLATLTKRQKDVLEQVMAGAPSKNIAADLGISQRTVESHRASIMVKSECKSLPALVRLAFMAS
jgi:two-component system CheB/CheR fusion protein